MVNGNGRRRNVRRADGDDRMPETVDFKSIARFNADTVFRQKQGMAAEDLDAVSLAKRFDALAELGDDFRFIVLQLAKLEASVL